jgi:hypothetical protein
MKTIRSDAAFPDPMRIMSGMETEPGAGLTKREYAAMHIYASIAGVATIGLAKAGVDAKAASQVLCDLAPASITMADRLIAELNKNQNTNTK